MICTLTFLFTGMGRPETLRRRAPRKTSDLQNQNVVIATAETILNYKWTPIRIESPNLLLF